MGIARRRILLGLVMGFSLGAAQTVALRDLEFEALKLSYIQTDRALAVLKSLGYTVVEFTGAKGEIEGEYKFTPQTTPRVNLQALQVPGQLPVIIKLPDTESITLVQSGTPKKAATRGKGLQIMESDLGGIPLENTTTGEPMQRLLVGYQSDDFEPVARLYNLIRNKIDVPAAQLLIEALVIELDSDRLNELGIDFGVGGRGFTSTFPPPSLETGAINPFTIVLDRTLMGNATTFQANLDALVSTKAAEILSKPSVLVLDGRQARIQVGQQIPITRTTASADFVEISVDYIPIGIVLNLRPRISEDGTRITVQVETIISETEERIGVAGAAGVLEAPVINNRRVQSFVRVANNTPFIIGGLISTKKTVSEGGIPILKDIPYLGRLFSISKLRDVKKEVIVVITPHIIAESEDNFSRVIPQDSELFNSFGNRSFPNSYRVQHTDVFDLRFIYESPIFNRILERVREAAQHDKTLSAVEPYKGLLAGRVPGEEILVRRMLYNIIEKLNYYEYIDPGKVIFFLDSKDDPAGFKVRNLADYIRELPPTGTKALRLSYSIRGKATLEKPFVRPTAKIDELTLDPAVSYKNLLKANNLRGQEPTEDVFTILIAEKDNERRLYEILILKKMLEMNPDLNLTLDYFKAGIEILFPSPDVLLQANHVVDRDAAKYFYEINDYYGSFETTFNRETSELTILLQE